MEILNILPILIPVVVVLILAVTIGPMLIRLARNSAMTSQVMQSGVTATATIVNTWDTGMRINDNPQVGIQLQVQPPNGAPFQAEVRQTVSIVHLGMYQPGATVQVKYDPANPSRVAIVGVMAAMPAAVPTMGAPMGAIAGTPMAGMNAQQAEQMLKQIDAANEALIKTGSQARAKVLQYLPMGINVNGSNPAVTLQLEVQPANAPKFNAQAQGVISSVSVPKFRPGQLITVRYDPNDLTRVTIERSGV